jgi:hypothetical protein
MHEKVTLIPESARTLAVRRIAGERILRIAHPSAMADEHDRETAAKDAISDVLTALVGPAGTHSFGGYLSSSDFALNEARRVLEQALRSWQGDAEDYTREPEPGEYGYEEPTS